MSERLYYTLDRWREPVPTTDPPAWERWMEAADLTVAETQVGRHLVSTVFLGLDLAFGMQGRPVLFQTQVLIGDDDAREAITNDPALTLRCYWTRRRDAKRGHAKVVRMLQPEVLMASPRHSHKCPHCETVYPCDDLPPEEVCNLPLTVPCDECMWAMIETPLWKQHLYWLERRLLWILHDRPRVVTGTFVGVMLGLATLAFLTKSIPMLCGIGALGIACGLGYVLAGQTRSDNSAR